MNFSPPPKPSDIELGDQSLDGAELADSGQGDPKA